MTADATPLSLNSPAAAPEPRRHVLWKWSIAITAIVLGYLMWQCGSGLSVGRSLSNAAVQQFHSELNNEQYDRIFAYADDGFRGSGKQEEGIKFLQAVHRKLGNAQQANLANMMVQATTGGTYIIAAYKTKFEHGDADEKFVWVRKDGQLKLYRYDVQSNVFVTG